MDNKNLLLDISMNMDRIGGWICGNYSSKYDRIQIFLKQTDKFISEFNSSTMTVDSRKTFQRFLKEYKLIKESIKRQENLMKSLQKR